MLVFRSQCFWLYMEAVKICSMLTKAQQSLPWVPELQNLNEREIGKRNKEKEEWRLLSSFIISDYFFL